MTTHEATIDKAEEASRPNDVRQHAATHLGAMIACLRKARGWNQDLFANAARISTSSLRRQESAALPVLRKYSIASIVEALNERAPLTNGDRAALREATGLAIFDHVNLRASDETLPPVPAGFFRCAVCATDTPLGKPCVKCFPPIEEGAVRFSNGRAMSRDDERHAPPSAAASVADDRCPCCGHSITEAAMSRAAVDFDKLQPGSLIMVTGKVLDEVMRVKRVTEHSVLGTIWDARERGWLFDRLVVKANVTGKPSASIMQALMRDGAMGRTRPFRPEPAAAKGGA